MWVHLRQLVLVLRPDSDRWTALYNMDVTDDEAGVRVQLERLRSTLADAVPRALVGIVSRRQRVGRRQSGRQHVRRDQEDRRGPRRPVLPHLPPTAAVVAGRSAVLYGLRAVGPARHGRLRVRRRYDASPTTAALPRRVRSFCTRPILR